MKMGYQVLENIISFTSKFNFDRATDLPLKIRHQSKTRLFDSTKPVALIIGELHPGATVKTPLGGINYFRSNSTITKFLLELYRNKDLVIGDALKEGFSKIEESENYENFSLDDFILNNLSPAITCVNILSQEALRVNFIPAESQAMLSAFAILSYLICSFPGECTAPDLEQKRIMEIFDNLSNENLKRVAVQVREFAKELFLDKEPFVNLVRKVKTDYDFELFSLRHLGIIGEQIEEINNLKAIIKNKLNLLCYERDKFITMNFMKFDSGIHPILVGELHVANLIKLLEEQGVHCVYLSTL